MRLPANPIRTALGEVPFVVRLDQAKKALGKDKRFRRGREEKLIQKRRGGGLLGLKPRQPLGVIADTQKKLAEVFRRSHKAILDRLVPQLPDEVLEREQAWKLARELAKQNGIPLSEAKRLASDTFEATNNFNLRDIARSIGVKAPEFSAPIGERWRREHVEKITKLSEESRDRIVAHLRDVGERGTRVEVFRKRLEETEGMGFRRARLVARDQVLTLNAKLTQDRHQRAGITQYRWLAARDGSTRENHAELDGETFSYDDPPLGGGTGPDDYGHPGEGIGCFPGSTKIRLTNGVRKAYRRRYSGELTKLVMETGEPFRATPNHPVLTQRGWVPAQEINVGDYVFEVSENLVIGPEVQLQHTEPTIEEIFKALEILSPSRFLASGALNQFHGDGSVDEEVEVVLADSSLVLNVEPSVKELALKFSLTGSNPTSFLESKCLKVCQIILGSSSGIVSGLGLRLAQFLARIEEADDVCSASSPDSNSSPLDGFSDGLSRDSELLAQCLNRRSLPIELEADVLRKWFCVVRSAVLPNDSNTTSAEDLGKIVGAASKVTGDLGESHPALKKPLRVIDKSLGEFSGTHVFNLETVTGWYVTSLVVENCRCQAIPIIPELEDS